MCVIHSNLQFSVTALRKTSEYLRRKKNSLTQLATTVTVIAVWSEYVMVVALDLSHCEKLLSHKLHIRNGKQHVQQ